MHRRGDDTIEASLVIVAAFSVLLLRVIIVNTGVVVGILVIEEHVLRLVAHAVVSVRVVLVVPLRLVRTRRLVTAQRSGPSTVPCVVPSCQAQTTAGWLSQLKGAYAGTLGHRPALARCRRSCQPRLDL